MGGVMTLTSEPPGDTGAVDTAAVTGGDDDPRGGTATASRRLLPVPPRPGRRFDLVVTLVVTLFVVWNLRPWTWFLDSTPTGGDLGAHVWSPAYLRDVLLPSWRLTGWTGDWYAGFPAFTFYMVLPSLAVVAVNVGLAGPLPAVAAGAIGAVAVRLRRRLGTDPGRRAALAVATVVALVLVVPVPYGIALKLVVVLGMVTLPAAGHLAARWGGLPSPTPGLFALMSAVFLFDRSFNIYGGNLMSTMAGEFAFSLALTTAVVYLGVAARGIETGRHRALAAVLLAATGLLHLFPAFFALVATAGLLVARCGRRALHWVLATGAVAGALSAFWVLPFVWNRTYLNDMGWGKDRRYLSALWSRSTFDYGFLRNDPPLQLFVVLAVVGALLALWRRRRLGVALAFTALAFAVAFVVLPEGRLWNVRLLPFYYLSIYLGAAVALGELAALVGEGAESLARRRGVRSAVPALATGGSAVAVAAVVLVALALPLRSLPGGSLGSDGVYRWGPLSTREFNLGSFWLEYNFRGYEDKAGYEGGGGSVEYEALMATMARVGERYGCGRALWEFESQRLGSYGTTMAPMLLPHWTDRCIASMEGLYFEASATTPFHFLMQSELSAAPSRAQRDLPYSGLDVATGVDHLQLLGVRYYMAFSPSAVEQARAEPELAEIATSGPWVIFLVADSEPVVGLDHLPVVWTDVGDAQDEWLEPAVAVFQAGEGAVLGASDGPDDWPRARSDEVAPRLDVDPVTVTSVVMGEQSLAFDVDRIGEPVLVKVSYFPNWRVRGARGPWRVTPNLMVVVPTDTHVEMTYARSGIEIVALVVTLVGIAAAIGLARGRRDEEVADADEGLWWDLMVRPRTSDGGPGSDGDAVGDGIAAPGSDGDAVGDGIAAPGSRAPAPGSGAPAPENQAGGVWTDGT